MKTQIYKTTDQDKILFSFIDSLEEIQERAEDLCFAYKVLSDGNQEYIKNNCPALFKAIEEMEEILEFQLGICLQVRD